jgi:hypothetical protein
MKKSKSISFWGPISSKITPISFKPIKFNQVYTKPSKKVPKRKLTYPQAVLRYPKLNPFGDADRDGKLNMFDCRPFDRDKDGFRPHQTEKQKETRRKLYTKLRESGISREAAEKIRDWSTPKIRMIAKGEAHPIALMDYKFNKAEGQWRRKFNPREYAQRYQEEQRRYREEKIQEYAQKYLKEPEIIEEETSPTMEMMEEVINEPEEENY